MLEVYSRTLPEDHPELQTARGNVAVTIERLEGRRPAAFAEEVERQREQEGGRARCAELLIASARARTHAARTALLESSPREPKARVTTELDKIAAQPPV